MSLIKDVLYNLVNTWWGIAVICLLSLFVFLLFSVIFYKPFFKRFYDIVLSFFALLILSPVMLILAIAVRINLGSPIIFNQKRPGKDCKIFQLHKFRTMTSKTDEQGNLLPDSERLTKFGKILRSTSLDELPEIWDIFRGKMSIIGPRPLLVEYLPLYSKEQNRRHDVRPGLTGLAQVNGRNSLSWEDKFILDVNYVEHISFWGDFRIFLKTIFKAIKRSDINSANNATMDKFNGIKKSGIIIIGAGGHAKVIADIIFSNNMRLLGFIDDNENIKEILGYPILGKLKDIERLNNEYDASFVIGIGKNNIRKEISNNYKIKWATLIHPSAIIAKDVKIGEGTVIMANVTINISANIGKHCIINTGCIIEHDNIIGDYCHISPNVALAGTVKIGELTHVGIGATVKNNINIAANCMIGAGAVVVKDTEENKVYIGVPAHEK